MSFDLELQKVHESDKVIVHICDIAFGKSAMAMNTLLRALDREQIILCSPYMLETVELAVHHVSPDLPNVLVRPADADLLAGIRCGNIVITEDLHTISAEALRKAVADIDKMIADKVYDEQYEKKKAYDDFRPPKEEVRWKQQQDRYRQKHHSKHFRKK